MEDMQTHMETMKTIHGEKRKQNGEEKNNV